LTLTLDVGATGNRMADLARSFQAIQDKRYAEAERISMAYADAPDTEHAMLAGLAVGLRGDAETAGRLLAHVAAERPMIPHPVDDLIRLLREDGREAEGLAHAEVALRLRPDDQRAMLSLSMMLTMANRPAEAEVLSRRALQIAPRAFEHLNQLGIALTDQGKFEEGLQAFRDAAAVDPKNNVAWTNMACTLSNIGRFDEALACYRRSIELKPDTASIRLNHAICLLKAGRLMQGWVEYQWRIQTPGHTTLPMERLLPSLDDETRLDGQRVLVTQEEGLGDTLQCMRWLAPLRDRGADVIVWVPGTLKTLMDRIPGITCIAGAFDEVVYAMHCPFLSLPRAFSATRQSLPNDPYITADPKLVAVMAAHLPQTDALRVGLVWGGAPRPENRQAYAVDRRRSMGLAALAALRGVDNLSLISLQHGPYRDELFDLAPGLTIHDPMDVSSDVHETAALMAELDVVVSVDTAMVHLAGGMGKQTILLDRFDNCWRWLHGRDDSPLYPSLRIIRQTTPGDWDGVVARLLRVLDDMGRQKLAGQIPSIHVAMSALTP
jgi:Flp pilus assembly protein TadD